MKKKENLFHSHLGTKNKKIDLGKGNKKIITRITCFISFYLAGVVDF
jgi:hypothetical protein